MNEPDTIFAIERQVLRHARSVPNTTGDDGHPLWQEFQTLLKSYERISSQMERLIRLSDRQQLQLKQAHDRIADQNARLASQNTALHEAAQLREDVEHITRHDLKSPLTTILGMTQLLRLDPALPASLDDSVRMLEEAGLLMLKMINLSLDLLKIERGDYHVQPVPVDLVGLVRKIMLIFEPLRAAKRISWAMLGARGQPLDALPALADGEELLCHTLLANLLKNAIEASPPGAAITVTFDPQPDMAGLHIHNQGTVPEPIRARFFQKYNTYGKYGGTGLGAYSAKMFTEVQGGALTMRTSEAAGTTLTVCLPVSRTPADAYQPSPLLRGISAATRPDHDPGGGPEPVAMPDRMCAGDLAQLPPALFESLRDAVQAVNVVEVEELLPQLRRHNPAWAAYFGDQCRHYRFDVLQALFENSPA